MLRPAQRATEQKVQEWNADTNYCLRTFEEGSIPPERLTTAHLARLQRVGIKLSVDRRETVLESSDLKDPRSDRGPTETQLSFEAEVKSTTALNWKVLYADVVEESNRRNIEWSDLANVGIEFRVSIRTSRCAHTISCWREVTWTSAPTWMETAREAEEQLADGTSDPSENHMRFFLLSDGSIRRDERSDCLGRRDVFMHSQVRAFSTIGASWSILTTHTSNEVCIQGLSYFSGKYSICRLRNWTWYGVSKGYGLGCLICRNKT